MWHYIHLAEKPSLTCWQMHKHSHILTHMVQHIHTHATAFPMHIGFFSVKCRFGIFRERGSWWLIKNTWRAQFHLASNEMRLYNNKKLFHFSRFVLVLENNKLNQSTSKSKHSTAATLIRLTALQICLRSHFVYCGRENKLPKLSICKW